MAAMCYDFDMGAVVTAREAIRREKMLNLYLHFVPVCCYRHFCLMPLRGIPRKVVSGMTSVRSAYSIQP